jgi:CubicO group peptidase (beta-lactamase class C family)
MTITTHGFAADGFERVADTFARTLSDCEGLGAALSIRLGGATVVDLWGGVADERTATAWSPDTASVIFSSTKGLVAILAARLVQEGRLDYDAPVTHYWPEYGQAGKETTLIRHLLNHQSGVSAPRDILTTADVTEWNVVVEHLQRQEPLWLPGEGHAYHALTFGWLIGEVIRRITGMTVGEYFRSLVSEPLHADAWIGLPASETARVAHLRVEENPQPVESTSDATGSADDVDWEARSMTLGEAFPPELVSADGGFNDRRIRAAEIPGAGGIATARALATVWSSTVTATEGIRLLDEHTVEEATRLQTEGAPVFGGQAPYPRWGMGFQLYSPDTRQYLGPASFGHDGAGGQVAFADPQHEVGFAYITNLMKVSNDARGPSLVEVLRDVLDGPVEVADAS